MKHIPWEIRNNKRRKKGVSNIGKHPSIVFAKSDDGKGFYNIGITHAKMRGHHRNIEIHDPSDWRKKAYVRDDIQVDSEKYLREILRGYRIHPKDRKKIIEKILSKKTRNKKMPH